MATTPGEWWPSFCCGMDLALTRWLNGGQGSGPGNHGQQRHLPFAGDLAAISGAAVFHRLPAQRQTSRRRLAGSCRLTASGWQMPPGASIPREVRRCWRLRSEMLTARPSYPTHNGTELCFRSRLALLSWSGSWTKPSQRYGARVICAAGPGFRLLSTASFTLSMSPQHQRLPSDTAFKRAVSRETVPYQGGGVWLDQGRPAGPRECQHAPWPGLPFWPMHLSSVRTLCLNRSMGKLLLHRALRTDGCSLSETTLLSWARLA